MTTPVVFDAEAARRAIRFVRRMTHTIGEFAGSPFRLQPWQTEVLAELFGWRRESDGLRVRRTGYLEIPRKNGKTELAAAIALYLLLEDDEPAARVYSAASEREQATLTFTAAQTMIENDDDLRERCRVLPSTKRILVPSTRSMYAAISAEAYSKHGLNASAVVYDELHAAPNRDLWDVLATSMGSRRQPLMLAITTAGYDRHSICWEQHAYAERVISGVLDDPTFWGRIYAAPQGADWQDRDVWRLANPNLGVSVREDFLEAECKRAQETPGYVNTFRRLYLCQWTEAESRWLDPLRWRACGGPIDVDALKGRPCYGALDLSSTTDMTAWVLVFPPVDKGERMKVVAHGFVPAESAERRSRRDRVPYPAWAEAGWLTLTPGSAVDHRVVLDRVREDAARYDLRELAFDRWGAARVMQDLQEMLGERRVIQFGQGFRDMSPPTKELEKLVLSCGIEHGDNPALTWCADNVVVSQDPAGNIKPDKQKCREKIDLLVATVMALDRALRRQQDGEPSVWFM